MPRWEPDTRNRLSEAALALFEEKGFEATTVAEIAERAGLTKRTFFRYFSDKREVLFAGTEEFEKTFVDGVRGASDSASPLEAIEAGLEGVAGYLQGRREFAPRRQAVLDANPELQERERTKMAMLASAGSAALRDRGVAEPAATLAGETGAVTLRTAFTEWIAADGKGDLAEMIRETIAGFRNL